MQNELIRALRYLGLVGLVAACVGCGNSKLGMVTGTVHMDGQPLEDAVITFYPKTDDPTRGGASYGRTDSEGKYELIYSRDEKGAEIGKHAIHITTEVEGGGGDYDPGRKETVPMKYNVRTTLTAEVTSGKNVIDFLDLTSDGEIAKGRGY